MKRIALMVVLLAIAIAASGSPGSDHKVTLCHVPPGNPANAHTISVDQSAVQAHLNHEDFIGGCEVASFTPETF
jgi:hypothetical protein